MLYAFVGGFAFLFSAALIANWAMNAPPRKLLNALRWSVFGLAGVVFLFLLLTGRLAWALAALAAMIPGGMRLVRLFLIGRFLHGMYRSTRNPFAGMGGGGNSKGTGQTSEVSSTFLRMRLDHDSGTMEGTVIAGTFAGQSLSALSPDNLRQLRGEVATDSNSLRLLEAWLDRAYPDWRQSADSDHAGTASSNGPMSVDEARRILDVSSTASAADIKDAYRRLMGRLHPDHGGSSYLAAKLNEARDVLLGNVGSDK